MIGDERVKLLASTVVPGQGDPGTVLPDFTIVCGSGAVRITLAQRAGKRPMTPADLLRGWALPPGWARAASAARRARTRGGLPPPGGRDRHRGTQTAPRVMFRSRRDSA